MCNIEVSPVDDLQYILNNIAPNTTILLKEGIYKQKLKICTPNTKILGECRETTIIDWDDSAKRIHADGTEYNTFRTYTVCVTGENVRLENFTIKNSCPDPVKGGQCVALSVNAKRFSAKGMNLVSTQDTLFTAPFPDDLVTRYAGISDEGYREWFIPRDELYMEGNSLHCFKDCNIYGTVDFIFGCAEAYFENCRIISLDDGRKESYIAAPAHSLKQENGFCFVNCSLESGGAAAGSVYLARPWRDFGKSVFIDCRGTSHINPQLFDRWNDTYRFKTARFSCYGLTGVDARPVDWCRELTKEQAEKYRRLCRAAMESYGL